MNKLIKTIIIGTLLFTSTVNASIKNVYDNSVQIFKYDHNVEVKQNFIQKLFSKNGTGSGFVSENLKDYIITNRHVIEGGKTFKVVNNLAITSEAKLVYVSATSDLAILKVSQNTSNGIKHCKNSNLFIGDNIYNFGNPEGINFIYTKGYVSGIKRPAHYDNYKFNYNHLTHNNINTQGQSGSALLESKSHCLAGVMVASSHRNKTGFSIPVEILDDMIADFKANKNNVLDLSTMEFNMFTKFKTHDFAYFDKKKNVMYLKETKSNKLLIISLLILLIVLLKFNYKNKKQKK